MSPSRPLFQCANCHAEIRNEVTFHVGLAFCCAGCVADGPCTCSYDVELLAEPAELLANAEAADERGRLVLAAG